jgi:hypothetical protein
MDRRSIQLAEGISNPALRGAAFERITSAWIEAGDLEKALSVIDYSRGFDAALRLRARIARRTIEAGQVDRGIAQARALAADPVWSPEAIEAVARAEVTRGRVAEAYAAAASIVNLELRLPALAAVVVRREAAVPASPVDREGILRALTAAP